MRKQMHLRDRFRVFARNVLLAFGMAVSAFAHAQSVPVDPRGLFTRAMEALQKGQYALAAASFDLARGAYAQQLGPDHPDVMNSMNNQALALTLLDRNAEAAELHEKARELRRQKLGADHPDTLQSMSNLANNYQNLGRLQEALALSEKTLALRQARLGADHPDTLSSRTNTANSLASLGMEREALVLREETLGLLRRRMGAEHPETIKGMGNLTLSYQAMGRLADAAKLSEETLTLNQRIQGRDHPDTLANMNNLANQYSALGRDADAFKLHEEAFAIRKAKFGPEHPDTLISMTNLAVALQALGRPIETLKLREETLAAQKSRLGVDHVVTLISMNNLAASYADVGRHDDARKLREQALELRRAKLGRDHPDTLASMLSLANSLTRDADAARLLEEVVSLRRSRLGPEHPDTLRSMDALASRYVALGQNAQALKLQEETHSVMRQTLGGDHPDTLIVGNNLATSYFAAGRTADAQSLRRSALAAIERQASSYAAMTREERSLALSKSRYQYVRYAVELVGTPQAATELFDVMERAKARSLLEELAARQAIANSGIPAASADALLALRNQLESVDGRLATAAFDEQRKLLRDERARVLSEMDALQKRLQAQHPLFAALTSIQPVSRGQASALLTAKAVFLAWVVDEKGATVSMALDKPGKLVAKQANLGSFLEARASSFRWLMALPNADMLADALQDGALVAWLDDGLLYLGNASNRPAGAKALSPGQYAVLRSAAIAAHGQWLADSLLKPMEAQLATAEQLILSPDGILATLPWDMLPWEGSTLAARRQLTLVQSLSVYKLLKDREQEYRTGDRERARLPLLAVGGAAYDPATAGQACASSAASGASRGAGRRGLRQAAVAADAMRAQGQSAAYRDMLAMKPGNLPCSLEEAASLHRLMGGQKLVGLDASERRLRELSDAGNLARFQHLHFAVHGILNTEFPSLSAILLTRTGNTEQSDGFVTASEWPAFRLRSDLLVMSACETGLGKIVNGEGVQGLPYALYVAGNRDTLLTLWPIDDEGTSVFMRQFWTRLKEGRSHAQALAATKQEMMSGRAGKQYADPFYWAAFVLYGIQD